MDQNLDTLEKTDRNKCNLLHHAVKKGDEKLAVYLVSKKPELCTAKNEWFQTPLHFACYEGNLKVIEAIIEKSTEIINSQDFNLSTPLHELCSSKADKDTITKIGSLLLDNGATGSIKLLDGDNNTPYRLAGEGKKLTGLLDLFKNELSPKSSWWSNIFGSKNK